MSTPHSLARLGLGLTLLLTGACSSPKLYEHNRGLLESAWNSMEAADFARAEAPLERLIIDTNPEAGEYALQRYYAAVLLVRLHMAAAYSAPFLQEPGGSSGRRRDEGAPSWLGHLMAANYDRAYADQWAESAERSPAEVDGQALLPAALADYALPDTLVYLQFVRTMVNARLGFQGEVADNLKGLRGRLELKPWLAAMDAARVTPQMRPWLLWAVFEYLKASNEPEAYKFGILAREEGRRQPRSFDQGLCEAVVRWIQEESKYEFESSSGFRFDPKLDADPDTTEPNIDFKAVLRRPAANGSGGR